MTITLELKPEVEANLVAQARVKGVSLARYIQGLIEQLSEPFVAQTTPPQDREAAFEEWADSFNVPNGVSEEAFHRENWYR